MALIKQPSGEKRQVRGPDQENLDRLEKALGITKNFYVLLSEKRWGAGNETRSSDHSSTLLRSLSGIFQNMHYLMFLQLEIIFKLLLGFGFFKRSNYMDYMKKHLYCY